MDADGRVPTAGGDAPPRRIPGATVPCGWCQQPTPVPARGRVPKWCSATCRHRAWEQKRAAESGRCAVQTIDRPVEVLRTVIEERVVHIPDQSTPRSAREWLHLLDKLGWALHTNKMTHDDLDLIEPKLPPSSNVAHASAPVRDITDMPN